MQVYATTRPKVLKLVYFYPLRSYTYIRMVLMVLYVLCIIRIHIVISDVFVPGKYATIQNNPQIKCSPTLGSLEAVLVVLPLEVVARLLLGKVVVVGLLLVVIVMLLVVVAGLLLVVLVVPGVLLIALKNIGYTI